MRLWPLRRRRTPDTADIPETRYFDEALKEIAQNSSIDEIASYVTGVGNEDDLIRINDQVYAAFENSWPTWNRIVIQRLKERRS